MRDYSKPGIFWTWQDQQIQNYSLLEAAITDMAEHGFGALLVQPRGCRYSIDDKAYIAAVVEACHLAQERELKLWLHLDPRSMSQSLLRSGGETAEYLIVAGTGNHHQHRLRMHRPLDVEATIIDGRFHIHLEYPKTRAYHVHSDGAVTFRPLRLERCLAFQRDIAGLVDTDTLQDITSAAQLFINELSGYVEVFGDWGSTDEGQWYILAFIAFGSNYPDYAGPSIKALLRQILDRYVLAGARLDGVWWDEPGYCTSFDRTFQADRGRIPYGAALDQLHYDRTGRRLLDDVLYLLAETNDGLWGARREEYYRTLENAVFGAEADLRKHAQRVLGDHVRFGVHQTWHQNADDVINGCMDWWRGAQVLGAGFADVGDAEQIDNPRQMAEVTALATIAVSLGRRSERREAFYNLWGVHYGESGTVPGPELIDWWVDLQATLGCNWLAHTYGPTGYFERPSIWGPGYPNHPTWSYMADATARMAQVLELTQGQLPHTDTALVYPLGTLFRIGSDFANPLAQGTHQLIDAMLRFGFELDVVSAEALREMPAGRFRSVIYLHPFGASPADVYDLSRRQAIGATVITAGLPPVAGEGYATASLWREQLGLHLPDEKWPDVLNKQNGIDESFTFAGRPWHYHGLPDWGRPRWRASESLLVSSAAAWRSSEICIGNDVGKVGAKSHYIGLLLEGLDSAPELLARLGAEPGWHLPDGALATRTNLLDGSTLLRMCPARFGQPYNGILRTDSLEIKVEYGLSLLCLRLLATGEVHQGIATKNLKWTAIQNGS